MQPLQLLVWNAVAMTPALASEAELKKMGGLSILEAEPTTGAGAEDEEDEAVPEVNPLDGVNLEESPSRGPA